MIAKRAQEITPFLVMDVLERAHAMEKEGVHVIHLEVEFQTARVDLGKEALVQAPFQFVFELVGARFLSGFLGVSSSFLWWAGGSASRRRSDELVGQFALAAGVRGAGEKEDQGTGRKSNPAAAVR